MNIHRPAFYVKVSQKVCIKGRNLEISQQNSFKASDRETSILHNFTLPLHHLANVRPVLAQLLYQFIFQLMMVSGALHLEIPDNFIDSYGAISAQLSENASQCTWLANLGD